MITIPDLVGPADADDTRAAVRALADADGVLSMDELADQLGHDSYTREWDDVFEALLDEERLVVLTGDRVGDAVTLLSHTTLTHRLSAEEIAGGWVSGDADFEPLCLVASDSFPLAAGGRMRVSAELDGSGTPTSRLWGPDGWLDGAAAGDLLGLRLADGLLHVDLPATPDVGAAAAAAFAIGAEEALELAGEIDAEPRVELSRALHEGLAAAGGAALHGTLPPLVELVVTAGLRRMGDFVVSPDGTEPDATAPDEPRPLGVALAVMLYHLDHVDAEALQDLRDARAVARTAALDGAAVRSSAAALARPPVVEMFTRETGADEPAVAVAEAVAASAAGAARAGALYVQAVAAERHGDARAAERLLADALAADGDCAPALSDAAWYAEDRGDAARALALLRRAGEPDPDDASRLLALANPPGGRVGRNQPCSCGSGRKFKACCGGRAGGPLPQRAEWLVDKVVAFALRPAQLPAFEPFIEARAIPSDESGWQTEAVTDPLVLDLGVFDGGVLRAFLNQRGFLLPADERELAHSWLHTQRSVYRVVQQRGDELQVSDVYTGQAVTVRGRDVPRLDDGTHLLGRALPCGDGTSLLFWAPLVLGAMPLRREWLELPPQRLAAALPRRHRWLTTTEGEPVMLVTQDFALTDHATGRRLLDRLAQEGLERLDDTTLHEVVDVGGGQPVRGRVMLDGHTVTVDTNAEARAERLGRLITSLEPDARLVADRRTQPWRFVDDQDHYGVFPPPYEPTAEERDAVAALLRQHEERWVDEPVPALGGLTPRQAAADPARRAELEVILDTPTSEGGFNGGRLRRLLELDA